MKLAVPMLHTASTLGMYPCYFPTPLYEITPRIDAIAPEKQADEGQLQICQEQPTAPCLCSAYSEQKGGRTPLDFATAEAAWRIWRLRWGGVSGTWEGDLLPVPLQGSLYGARPLGMVGREAEGPKHTLLASVRVAPTWGRWSQWETGF